MKLIWIMTPASIISIAYVLLRHSNSERERYKKAKLNFIDSTFLFGELSLENDVVHC